MVASVTVSAIDHWLSAIAPKALVGRHGFAPCSRRVRAGTSLPKFAAQSRHEDGVEPPQPGLCDPCRHRDFASREMVLAHGHREKTPFNPQ